MNDVIQILKKDGFEGFISVENLMKSHKIIPTYSGVYLFLRLNNSEPEFLERGTGGFFKRKTPKNPNVSVAELRDYKNGICILTHPRGGEFFFFFSLPIQFFLLTFVAVKQLAMTYQTTIAQQRNFDSFAFFSALYLVVSDILLTHTHTTGV